MDLIQVLEITCSTDVSSCCSDYGIATYLYIIKKALNMIQMIVPIILIVMGTIQLVKMMIDPEDKGGKGKKNFLNKFVAAGIIFLMPFAVNVLLGIIPDSFDLAGCWESSEAIVSQMNSSVKYTVTHTDNRKKADIDVSKYKIIW